MRREKQTLGAQGEAWAVQFLLERGYTVLRKNFHCRFGEVDVIALDETQNQLVFVEVKTRRGVSRGFPEEAAHPLKMEKVRRAALWFLSHHPEIPENYRFDLIAIVIHRDCLDLAPSKQYEIRHYEALTMST